jgi:preprotein translocase subunit SecG
MKEVMLVLNIIISAILVALILMQGRGAGMGSAWGGSGETFQTRRGIEKVTLRLTIFFIILFFVVSAVNFFL